MSGTELKKKLTNLAGRITASISRQSYRRHADGLQPIGALPGMPGGALILPRRQVLFSRLEISGIPRNQRREAIRLELEQLAPFEDPGAWVRVNDAADVACVWYWPGTLEDTGSPQAAHLTPIPENVTWPELADGEYRWIEAADQGLFVLQYQSASAGLFEERFATNPSAATVQAWLKRHGCTPRELKSTPPPPAASVGPGWSLTASRDLVETTILPLATAVMGVAVVTFAIANLIALVGLQAAEQRTAKLEREVADTIELRREALALEEEIRRINNHFEPTQVAIAAELARALDARSTSLMRWSYRDGSLQLAWNPTAGTSNPTEIISKVEALPEFANVEAVVEPKKHVELTLDVDRSSRLPRSPINALAEAVP